MRNIVITHPFRGSQYPNLARHIVVTADFDYYDGMVARQCVEGSPATAYARAMAWARRCMDPIAVEKARDETRKSLAHMREWGCE